MAQKAFYVLGAAVILNGIGNFFSAWRIIQLQGRVKVQEVKINRLQRDS
jgi:hypothetical protein